MDDHLHMIEEHLITRGIKDPRVLNAMQIVKRTAFVPAQLQKHAYDDNALPIGYDQTISQPYVVAYMLEKLQIAPDDIVLEIGTGSGYLTALLCEMISEGHIYSIETVKPLAERASLTLQSLGYHQFSILITDGSEGAFSFAPFDKIIVSAASKEISQEMLHQLKPGGKMIAPVGKASGQRLLLYEFKDGAYIKTPLFHVSFVPLVGKYSI